MNINLEYPKCCPNCKSELIFPEDEGFRCLECFEYFTIEDTYRNVRRFK